MSKPNSPPPGKSNGCDGREGSAEELAREIAALIDRYDKRHRCGILVLYLATSIVHNRLQGLAINQLMRWLPKLLKQ